MTDTMNVSQILTGFKQKKRINASTHYRYVNVGSWFIR